MADQSTDALPVGRMSTADVVWSAHSITSSDFKRALVFESRGMLFALSAAAVSEVTDVPATQSVPGSAAWFAGISVYRNRPVPVIDAAAYLAPESLANKSVASGSGFNRAIAVRAASSTYLIVADRILTLCNLPAEVPPQAFGGVPAYAEHRAIRNLCTFENHLLAVVDLPELLRCTKLLRECAFC